MAMTVWPEVANPLSLSLSLSLSAKGTGVAKGTFGFHPMKRMSSDCGCDESRQEKNKAHVLTEAKRTAMWRCAYAGKPSEKTALPVVQWILPYVARLCPWVPRIIIFTKKGPWEDHL